MNPRDKEKGTEEHGREVADLLATLPRVEAPANFDFGVKARIAAGGSKRRSTIFSFLKVAVPLSLVLALGGFAIFYGTMPSENISVASVAVPQNYAPEPDPVTSPDEIAARNEPPPQVAEPKDGTSVAVSADPKKEIPVRRAGRFKAVPLPKDDDPTFTKDSDLTPATIISPPGIPASGGELPVREILESLGMKVDYVGGAWTVRSTLPNGVAEKSGLLANDIVESINDRPIGGTLKLKGNLEGRTVTVGRSGKSIKLDLRH